RLIFWELTAGCNLKCIHCRAEATPERLKEELSTSECLKVVDSIISFSRPILILTGGEPLYRKDIFEIAGYASGKGLRVALATNGTLITPEVAEEIVKAGIKRVSISLDGATAGTHDTFRGEKGSFNKALEGFKNLQNLGMSVQLNTTIARHNVKELPEILKSALKMKADALHVFMLVPVGCGLKVRDSQMLPPEEYEEVLNWFYRESKLHPEMEFKATCAPHYSRIMRQNAVKEGRMPGVSDEGMRARTKGCLAGTGVCFISRLGVVQPCGYLPVEAGNVRKEELRDIWEKSPVFLSLREPIKLGGKCGICEYRKTCEGCRARAYAATGDYLSEEPYCVYQPLTRKS
ncbi:MAG: radical SAM protein, partial [Nitrospirota bacterium]